MIDIVAEGSVNGNIIIADAQGIHWHAIQEAAKMIKAISMRSSHGDANADFSAMALIKPYGPYYPSSYYLGKGHAFTLAMEGANVVQDIFTKYHDPREAEQQLTAAFLNIRRNWSPRRWRLQRARDGRTRESTQPRRRKRNTPSAQPSSRLAAAPFGSSGSLTAAGIIARALLATPIKRAGTSGPMLPVLEDPTLSSRWGEGTYTITSLLAYSAVGANGLETVPLPGDVTEQQIAGILGDVATVAFKDKTPLSARLLPSPGRHAGEKSDYTVSYMINTTLQPLPGATR